MRGNVWAKDDGVEVTNLEGEEREGREGREGRERRGRGGRGEGGEGVYTANNIARPLRTKL